jgi:hypothetical protein
LEERAWAKVLKALASKVNPVLKRKGWLDLQGYYWTVQESEYATDVMFKDEAALARIYPKLTEHAMRQFGCQDVLRFLGRRTNRRFDGEACSDIKVRPEGMRIKHRVEENSIKMYDKQATVLRIETTINNPRRFKVRDRIKVKGRRRMGLRRMRKGGDRSWATDRTVPKRQPTVSGSTGGRDNPPADRRAVGSREPFKGARRTWISRPAADQR